MKDYYRVLEVERDASQEEIKQAYRRLSLQYHPDTTVGDKKAGERKMKDLNEAYAVLSDPAKRRRYDAEWKSHHQKRTERMVTISYEDSLLGDVISVNTRDVRSICVTVPEYAKDGDVIYEDDYLRVTVRVQSPRDESERDRAELARQIMSEYGVTKAQAQRLRDRIYKERELFRNESERVIRGLQDENDVLWFRHSELSKRVSQSEVEESYSNEFAELRDDNVVLREAISHLEDEVSVLIRGNALLHEQIGLLLKLHDRLANGNFPNAGSADHRGSKEHHSAADLFSKKNHFFSRNSSGGIAFTENPTPRYDDILDYSPPLLKKDAGSGSPHGDTRSRNTPKPPRERSRGPERGMRTEVPYIGNHIGKGRRKKR